MGMIRLESRVFTSIHDDCLLFRSPYLTRPINLLGSWVPFLCAQCFYDVEPLEGLTAADAKYVWGGQGCQWSEGINAHNFDARTWTNLAAVGERLWSPRALSHPVIEASAATRLVEHVCRMNSRGIDANPISPSFCPQADFMSMKHQY